LIVLIAQLPVSYLVNDIVTKVSISFCVKTSCLMKRSKEMVEKSSSIKNIARFAGLVYVLIAIIAILANSFVLESLIVPGDAATTASNIMANELLFRSGIASFMVLVILDVVMAWALHFTQTSKQESCDTCSMV
jgi:hypothetical protein